MADAEVHGATLERTFVFPEVTISNADVSKNVVDQSSIVNGVDLGNAVIGEHTFLRSPSSDERI